MACFLGAAMAANTRIQIRDFGQKRAFLRRFLGISLGQVDRFQNKCAQATPHNVRRVRRRLSKV